MSYVKIDKEELKKLKINLDNEIQKLTTNFNTINTKLPFPRNIEDPSLKDINNREGIDYLTIANNYNNAINNIKNSMETNNIIKHLTTISNKIQTIIDTIDSFNDIDYSNVEKDIKELSEKMNYLDEFTGLDRVELFTITDFSAGEKKEEKEENEEISNVEEEQPTPSSNSEKETDETSEDNQTSNDKENNDENELTNNSTNEQFENETTTDIMEENDESIIGLENIHNQSKSTDKGFFGKIKSFFKRKDRSKIDTSDKNESG